MPTQTPSPRDFQKEDFEAVLAAHQKHQCALGRAATGLGKAVLLSMLAKHYSQFGRVMILVDVKKLVRQLAETLTWFTGIRPGIEMGEERAVNDDTFCTPDQVVISTVQTQYSGPVGKERYRKFIKEDFAAVLFDECELFLAPKAMEVAKWYLANESLRAFGCSVGPDSFIEMTGGCFGNGFVGSIEDAFNLAEASGLPVRRWREFDVIDLSWVVSRGWTGTEFAWKACKRILRHSGDGKSCRRITAAAGEVSLTDDHSIYIATPGQGAKVAGSTNISCIESHLVKQGDILLADDGNDWVQFQAPSINVLDICRKGLSKKRIHVACDVMSLDRSILKNIGLSPKEIYAMRQRRTIPLRHYDALGELAPRAEWVVTEGSFTRVAPFINLQDWAYFLGFFLGDGWLSRGGSRIGFAIEDEQIDAVQSEIDSLAGVKWKSHRKRARGRSWEVRVGSIVVWEILRSVMGRKRCFDKFIPGEWITSWGGFSRHELIRGLLDSDGARSTCSRRRRPHVYVTTSPKLAAGVRSLMRSIGVSANMHTVPPGVGGTVRGRVILGTKDSIRVSWSGNLEDGFRGGHYGHRRSLNQVRKHCQIPSPKYVYDLEMEGHPSFVANGILVHNTATPMRTDGVAMANLFDTVAFDRDILWGIANGWLCPAKQAYVRVNVDFSTLSVKKNYDGEADYNKEELAATISNDQVLIELAKGIIHVAGKRKSIVVCPTVEVAKGVCHYICGERQGAARVIYGEMTDEQKDDTFAAFEHDEFQFLTSVMLLTKGFDSPGVSAVFNCRKTRSKRLYAQILGRGTRPLKGLLDGADSPEERKARIAASAKPNMIMANLVGVDRQTRDMTIADILGEADPSVMDRAKEIMEETGAELDDALEQAEGEVEESQDAERAMAEAEAEQIAQDEERDLRRRVQVNAHVDVEYQDGLDVGTGESSTSYSAVSDCQLSILRKFKVPESTISKLPPGQLNALSGKLLSRSRQGLCSFGQAACLHRAGYQKSELTAMTRQQASAAIESLKANGWKRPVSA
jgi:superfamily II DNA or RNA helicase